MVVPAISTALGLVSALAGAGGAAMGALRNKQNERELMAQRSDIDRELYTGALDSVGAKAYLKQMGRNAEKVLAGIDNGIIAGGATAENALAQKQRLNETLDSTVNNLLHNKEATKRGYFRDRMQLTNAINNGRAQQAENWMTLAGNIANTAQNLGEAYLEDGKSLLPDSAPAQEGSADVFPDAADAAAKAAAAEQVKMQETEAPEAPTEPEVKRELVKFSPEEELEEERLRNLTGQNG